MLLGLRRSVARALPPMPPLDRRARWALGGLLGIGAVLRIAWGYLGADPPRGPELHDPVLYLILGDNISHGHGYSYGDGPDQGVTAFYPPGYPVVLGAVFWLARLLPGTVQLFDVAVTLNLVLSVATVAVVFSLGRRLVGVPVGLIAAAVFAFWPNLVVYTGVALTETLFLFLFALTLLLALASPEVARAPGRMRLLTVGLLFGAAGMVRPISFVLAPLFLVLWWREGTRVAVRRAALVGAAVLVLVLPWTVRNAVQMDSFVLISTNMGDNLCIGNHPGATGAYEIPAYCNLGDPGDEGVDEPRPGSEIVRQDENVDLALQHIRDEPIGFFTKMPAKLRWTLDRDTDGLWAASDYGQHDPLSPRRMDLLEWASNGYYAVVGVVGAVGAVLLALRQDAARRRSFFLLAALVQLLPPLVTFGDSRFKMPIYPALAVGVGVVVMAVLERRLPGRDVDRGDAPAGDLEPDGREGTPPRGESPGEGDQSLVSV